MYTNAISFLGSNQHAPRVRVLGRNLTDIMEQFKENVKNGLTSFFRNENGIISLCWNGTKQREIALKQIRRLH